MLENITYKREELAKMIKCNPTDKQAITRKLDKYGVVYTYDPIALTFTITDCGDRFRQFCVWDLGLRPNMDFPKFALFVYLVFEKGEPGIDYNTMPLEELANQIAEKYPTTSITRQTMTEYIEYLRPMGIFRDLGSPIYVVVANSAVVEYKEITAAEYGAMWKYYYKQKQAYKADPEKADLASSQARTDMILKYGGYPKKHYPLTRAAAWTREEFATLTTLAMEKVIRENLEGVVPVHTEEEEAA